MFPPPDLNLFNCGLIVTDEDRRVLYANSFVLNEYGHDPDLISAEGLSALFTRSSLILFDSYLYPMLLQEGVCQELQVMVQTADEERVPVLISVKQDTTGTGHHYWALFDATNRSKLYDELIETREKLQDQAESLANLAKRDALTGLLNRRELTEQFAMLLSQANRADRAVSVLLIDIDHFKTINDEYGHQRGDMVLREFGGLLQKSCRTGDVAARYGGEEFIVLLPDTAITDAAKRAERIHEKLSGIEVGGLRVSVSIGISEKKAPVATDAENMIRKADEALYMAKNAGRGCTRLADA